MPTAVVPTAGDLSPAMLVQASKRRSKFGIDVELLDMDVFATTFPDRYFDAIVTTFLFCVLEASQQRMLYAESYSILLDLLRRWPREHRFAAHAETVAELARHSPHIDWDSICLSHTEEG